MPQFDPQSGLVAAIIQDSNTLRVLMLGYMNAEALTKTQREGIVTFWSRSKKRLWTKGETSGNTLHVVSIEEDCDQDALLIKVIPQGPTCHTGTDTCWGEANSSSNLAFLTELERTIQNRIQAPTEGSYVAKLLSKGTAKIAQKVGEEAVETVIEAIKKDTPKLNEEAADLLFHLLLLLNTHQSCLTDVLKVLKGRAK
ncbi:MAG: bifunctional phosphoribosyl-AMP cyclohydrolase/phosphoribosyl-ATP diphosphatase HisIE [Cytophagales bacterium]|nr:MAG: bifunctional phosphoribosyl-AMP cyclohydrolase/phosphoribosyl-ATP diphosphatase HisIE [Cytophagales bacterium]TAF60831.1 MAG: bifunctional phosphoribosyl-AMP cyclohydrolase/phosphoribosyl-ATP diphosphatase HisIE [Cytophagales bacterium]